jgi:hypothetical protein
MPSYKREFVFSGDDLFIYDFPEKTRIIYPPDTVPPVIDERAAVIHALDRPFGAPPLISQVNMTSRVTIAFDDPCLPVPHMVRDPRETVITAVIEKLFSAGVKKENIRLICAGGLHRNLGIRSPATTQKIPRESFPSARPRRAKMSRSTGPHLNAISSSMLTSTISR